MRVYSSMTTEEFVAQLREIAVGANAGPLFIDQIDRLEDARDREEELERVGNELAKMEESCNDYKYRFERLLEACQNEQDPSEALLKAIAQATEE